MIENITEEVLQEIISQYVLPESNMGVHQMTGGDGEEFIGDYNRYKEVYDKILQNGFRYNNPCYKQYGIVSNVLMCGLDNDEDSSKRILDWDYSSNGRPGTESIKIIFAIPSIIETDNTTYYIGEYPANESGNMYNSRSIPFGDLIGVKIIPKEFILGHLKVTYGPGNETMYWTTKQDFELNKDYIGLKTPEEQRQFFNEYESILKKDIRILTFDERGYQLAKFFKSKFFLRNKNYFDSRESLYYLNTYYDKYRELTQGIEDTQR